MGRWGLGEIGLGRWGLGGMGLWVVEMSLGRYVYGSARWVSKLADEVERR